MTQLAKTEPTEGKRFSEYEWRAYEAHKKASAAGKEAPLGPTVIGQMFEQFLHGMSPSQIAREWKGYQLGAIVRAAVENQWFDRRAEYLDKLHSTTTDRAKQIAAESVEFTGALLAVAHKRWGARLRRYLATGDEAELGEFEIRSIDQYRKVIQTFLELTGHKPSDFLRIPEGKEGAGSAMSPLAGMGLDIAAILSTKRIQPEHAAALLALVSAPPVEEKEVETVTVR